MSRFSPEDAEIAKLTGANLAYLEKIESAGTLLDEALYQLKGTDHRWDCPRLRDDYDCTCGLSDLKARIEEWLSD